MRHTIGLQVLDFSIDVGGREADHFDVQHRLSELATGKIAPALAAVFDRHLADDGTLILDRLEIDVGTIHLDSLEQVLPGLVRDQVATQLSLLQPSNQSSSVSLSASERTRQLWLHVLGYGTAPWWADPNELSRLDADVIEFFHAGAISPAVLVSYLMRNINAQERLIVANPEIRLLAMALLTPETTPIAQALIDFLNNERKAVNDIARRSRATITAHTPKKLIRKRHLRGITQGIWRIVLAEGLAPRSSPGLSRIQNLVRRFLDEVGRVVAYPMNQVHVSIKDALQQTSKAQYQNIADIVAALPTVKPTQTGQRTTQATPSSGGARVENEPTAEPVLSRKDKSRGGTGRTTLQPDHRGDEKAESNRSAPRDGQKKEGREHLTDTIGASSDSVNGTDSLERLPEVDLDTPRKRAFGTSGESPLNPRSEEPPTPVTPGTIYVANAGAVLLHPFLGTHFERLGWIEGGAFANVDARDRAIHQIYYLTNDAASNDETQLALAKVLCGCAPEAPVQRAKDLKAPSKAARREATAVLEALIANWPALKSTSIDGLREAFLQRTGRLERSDSGWRLRVEPSGVDILLARLAWSSSLVRLRWMEHILYIDWG